MKRTMLLSLATLALGGMIAVPGFAQTSSTSGAGPGVYDPGHPRVNEVNRREQIQQQRINQGVRSGQLTLREAGHLQRQENRIQRREAHDMAAHNGHLTRAETRRLNRAQNRESRRIYRKKHNRRMR
jgi:hypothetical protein